MLVPRNIVCFTLLSLGTRTVFLIACAVSAAARVCSPSREPPPAIPAQPPRRPTRVAVRNRNWQNTRAAQHRFLRFVRSGIKMYELGRWST